MRTIALLLCGAACLSAQVLVSFSPGTRLSRGVYRWSVTACSAAAVELDTGWIYQTAQSVGIQTLSVAESMRLATRAHNRDPMVATLTGMQIGTQVSAYLVASGSIKSDPKVTGYLLLASGAVTLVENMLRPQIPPDYAANLLQGTIGLPAGGCVQREVFTRTMRAVAPIGPIPVRR